MGKSCGTKEEEKKYIQVFKGEEREMPSEAIWKYNTKMHLKEIRCSRLDWIKLAQYREKWHAVVNMVVKFGFHRMRLREFLPSQKKTLFYGVTKEMTFSEESLFLSKRRIHCFRQDPRPPTREPGH
jgi:hypothetical protein